MEKISWTDRVRNEEVLNGVKDETNILHTVKRTGYILEARHPLSVSNKSNYNMYMYIVRHNYVLGGTLFTIHKAQLHVSAFWPYGQHLRPKHVVML